MNHGFIKDIILPEDYVLGAFTKIPEIILQPNGNWMEFLPDIELQRKNDFESMNCTSYGTLNCIETLLNRLFGFGRLNFSERYIGIMAETTQEGNSPQKIIETIRKEAGLLNEELLPFDNSIDSWEKYYSPKPMLKNYIDLGKKWLEDYLILHEWIFGTNEKNKISRLKQGLKLSPLGVSVNAWEQEEDGLYFKEKGASDNHWVMLYGYKEGKYWDVFDHYDNTFKQLKWNYDFESAKRYYIEKKKKEIELKKPGIWEKIKRSIKEYLEIIFK